MNFPEKNKLNFKKCSPSLQMDTFGNYLKSLCTFKRMNTDFCVYYSEMHTLEIQQRNFDIYYVTLRYQAESHSVK